LSRIMVGSQASLLVGLGGIAVGATLGSLIGLVAGYRGGWLDEGLMTLGDIQLAFPLILLAMAVIAVLGPSLPNLILVTGLSAWWIVVLPSLALLLTTRSISRLGDWLRDLLDPTRRAG